MKKYLLALLAALGLASVGFAAETVFGDSPVAVWRDFHNLTSGGYTLNKDDACTVNEDGSIILGGQGLSLTGLDLENASVLLEVSSIPTSSGSLVSYFVSSGENDQYVTLFKNGTNYYFGDNATTGGGEDASCGTLTLTSNPFMFNHSKVDGTAMLYNPSDTDDKYTRAPLHWSTHNIKSIYIGSYDGVTTEGVKAPLAGLTIKAIYLYSNYYNNSWPTKMNLVAECNGLPYSSLSDALDAVADGGTITLLQDVVLASSLALPNLTLTLDLGGKILSVEGVQTSGVPAIKVDNGTITLKNGTVKGNSPAATYSGSAAVLVSGACTLNLEGVTLVGGDSIDAGMGSALQFNNQAKNAVVTINNSTLQGGTTTASEGEAIKGGSGNAIEMHADVASSVSITMTGENTLWASEYASPYSTATACVVYNTGNASSDAHALVAIAASGTINVTGGLLHNVDLSTTSEVVIKVAEPGAISDNMDYVVNGKNAYTITDEGTTVTVAALTAETAEAEINGTFYRSFIGAVNAAAEGETITLHKEVTVTSSYTLKKGVTVEGTVSGVAASVANTRYNTTTYYTTFTEAAAALGSSWTSTLVMLAGYTATDNIAIGDISGAGVVAIDTNEQTLTLGDYIFYSGSVEANKAPVQAYDTGTKCWYIGGESKLPDLFKKELTGDVSVQLNGDVYMTASTVLAGENVTIDLNGHEISNASSGSLAMAHAAGLPLFKVGESKLTITDSEGTGSLAQYEGSVFAGGITSVESPTLDNCFTGIVEGVGSVSITGGSYPVDPTPYLAAGYNTSTEDGKITVGKFVAKIGDKGYASLEAALDAAMDGQILKLLADVDISTETLPTYTGTGTVNFDLNGFTLVTAQNLGTNIHFLNGYALMSARSGVSGLTKTKTHYYSNLDDVRAYMIEAAKSAKRSYCSIYEPYTKLESDWTLPMADATTSGFYVFGGYDVTIDLNGYTLRQVPESAGKALGWPYAFFGNDPESKLTITDSSEGAKGEVIAAIGAHPTTGVVRGSLIYSNGGEVYLSGGTFRFEEDELTASQLCTLVNTEKFVVENATLIADGPDNYAAVLFYTENAVVEIGENTSVVGMVGAPASANFTVASPNINYVNGSGWEVPVPSETLAIVGDWVVLASAVDENAAMIVRDGKPTFYKTLAEAIASVEGEGTIALLQSVTENVTIAAEQTITLDLNGKTINGGTVANTATIANLGTLTIVGRGTIKRDDEGYPAYYTILNNGTMTIEAATVTNASGTTDAWKGSALICNVGHSTEKPATLTITGGTYRQMNFIVIKNDDYGILNIQGGTFTTRAEATAEGGVYSAIQNWSQATISGGTITGAVLTGAWATDVTTTISGTADINGKIVADKVYSDGKTFSIAINGGNLEDAALVVRDDLTDYATVTKADTATMGAPAGFKWNASGVLEKLVIVEEDFTVKANNDNFGSVSKSELGNDGFVEIRAEAKPGYTFVGWSGTGDYAALPLTNKVVVTENTMEQHYVAHFVPTATYTTVTNDLSQTTLNRADLVKWDDILDLSLQNPSIELTEDANGNPVVFAGIQVMKLSGVDADGTPQWESVTDATVHSYTEEKIKLQLPTKSNTRFLRVIDHK